MRILFGLAFGLAISKLKAKVILQGGGYVFPKNKYYWVLSLPVAETMGIVYAIKLN